jgi:hypothetical protein
MSIKKITGLLGITFEMAICLLFDIKYDGNYKYNLDNAIILKNRINKLKDIYSDNYNIKHIAKNQNKYDFMIINKIDNKIDNEIIYLNAKTSKKDGKVCPQIIGQPSKKKFCEYFKIDLDSKEQIQEYIINNINKLLDEYLSNTFDSSIIYYNEHYNKLLFIKLKNNINWIEYDIQFRHIIKNKNWNESSSILINNTSIGEFQIHNNRDCIKFRWIIDKLLDLFNDNFEIINL